MYFARIAGQFYDRDSAVRSFKGFGLLAAGPIEQKRKKTEAGYDSVRLSNAGFLEKSKDNRILNRYDVNRTSFKESRWNFLVQGPSLGTLTIALKEKKTLKLIMLPDQDIDGLKAFLKVFSDFSEGKK